MGKTNGPVLGVSTYQDYQDNKWQFVQQKYGVYDPHQGVVLPMASRERAQAVVEDNRWGLGPVMTRHVSDWVLDER